MNVLKSHTNEIEERGENQNQRVLRRKAVNSTNLKNSKTSKLRNNVEHEQQNKKQNKNSATTLSKDCFSTPRKNNLRNNFRFRSLEKPKEIDIKTPSSSKIVERSSHSDGAKNQQQQRQRVRRKLNKSADIPNKNIDQNESIRLALTTKVVVSVCRTNHPTGKNLNDGSPKEQNINKKRSFLSPIEKLLIKNGSKSIFDTPIKLLCNNLQNNEEKTNEFSNRTIEKNISKSSKTIEKSNGTIEKFNEIRHIRETFDNSNESIRNSIKTVEKSNEADENSTKKYSEAIDHFTEKLNETIENSTEKSSETIEDSTEKSIETIDHFTEKLSETIENSTETSSESIENCTETSSETIENCTEKSSETIENSTEKSSEAIEHSTEIFSETIENSSENIENTHESIDDSSGTNEKSGKSIENFSGITVKSTESDENCNEIIENTRTFVESSSETIDNTHESVENSSGTIEHSRKSVENSSGIIENSSSDIEKYSNSVEKSRESFENSNVNIENSTDTIENSGKTIDNSTGIVEKSSENIENSIGPFEKSSETIKKSNETSEKSDENIILAESEHLDGNINQKDTTANTVQTYQEVLIETDKNVVNEQKIVNTDKNLLPIVQVLPTKNDNTDKTILTTNDETNVQKDDSKIDTTKTEKMTKKLEKEKQSKTSTSVIQQKRTTTKSDKKQKPPKRQKVKQLKIFKHKIKVERKSTDSNEGYSEQNIYMTTTSDHLNLVRKPVKQEISGSSNSIGTSLNALTEITEKSHELHRNLGITDHLKSPSVVSEDSAKGSSVNEVEPEIEIETFSVGDLFWGQIFNYCYWPCMVCPDPKNQVISESKIRGELNIIVHVRFFADNGRRNWVKKENLLTYKGLEDFQEKAEQVKKLYGKTSAKYRLYIPKPNRERTWIDAIREANIVYGTTYPERLNKFCLIYESAMELQKIERKRRRSILVQPEQAVSPALSKLRRSSRAGSVINILKRERSSSPMSPAFSPISRTAKKRRKFSTDSQENSLNANSILTPDVYDFLYKNFNNFLYFLQQGILGNNNKYIELENSLYVAARNIWSLKKIKDEFEEQEKNQNAKKSPENFIIDKRQLDKVNNHIKCQTIQINDVNISPTSSVTLTTNKASAVALVDEEKSIEEKQLKVPLSRPIDEVIQDIYELDNKYLFRGLMRDPICKYCLLNGGKIVKCSNNCGCWFHFECNGKSVIVDDVKTKKYRRRTKINNKIPIKNKNTDNDNNNNNNNNNNEMKKQHDLDEPICSKYAIINPPKNEDTLQSDYHITAETTENEITSAVCEECKLNDKAKCFICHQNDIEMGELMMCKMLQCKRRFHQSCCRYWPQSQITISNKNIESFRCPSHACHTCASDDPRRKFHNLGPSKLVRCIKCPASYHIDSTCIPAGSLILSTTSLICPRHFLNKSENNINVSWCFICVHGGRVVCCETCPIAVHAGCMKIEINSSEGYICEECESGRLPLYGEIVWAKFNTYRWWPAIILPPTEVPQNIMKKPHNPSEFVVRFFGTHDHAWISRRRVYLYVEGDCSEPPKLRRSLDQNYIRGVEEAKRIYEIVKVKKQEQIVRKNIQDTLHPQSYVRIKTNRPVPPVKLHTDLEKVNKCECDPRCENPCGFDSNCLNRVLFNECNPKICPAGPRCQNQMFEKRKSPRLKVVFFNQRGFGLICLEPIKMGSFVIEYVGEIINEVEFKQRLARKSKDCDENYYFLSVEKDYIIDAGPKGNLARFMNHSCDPNCETQKWTVNGLNRIGLFAIKDIPETTELTFNYHWDELLGNEKKICFCESDKCIGEIGGKLNKEEKQKDAMDAKKSTKSVKRSQKNPKRKNSNTTKAAKAENGTTNKKRSLIAKKKVNAINEKQKGDNKNEKK